MKIIIGDKKSSRTYAVELSNEKERALYSMKIGEIFDGGILGSVGYKFKITGGSDKEGFPMRADLDGIGRKAVILGEGIGYKGGKRGKLVRKNIRGNIVSEFISQLNVSIFEYGPSSLDEIFGKKEKEEK